MDKDLQLLTGSVADLQWFRENSEGIIDEFQGNFIALKDKKIVSFAPEIKILLGKLEKKGVDGSTVLIKKINPRGEIVIL